MAGAGFFRGTNLEQDARFYNNEKKLLQRLKYPPNIGTKVDMSKVNLNTIKPWITQRVTQLLGVEDDVVVEFIFNMLEKKQFPDPRELQMNLTGFLHGKNARIFMQELWELLTSAQESIGGIPTKFLEQKKEEIRQKLEQERIQASLKKHEEVEREILEQRQREYEERQARKREEEEEERKETRREARREGQKSTEMTDVGFFQGTNLEQDARFYNNEKKLLKRLKYPPNIGTKVDMSKVNLDTIKPWITQRVTQLLGVEDGVVVELIFNMLEKKQFPDPCELQMNLTGFLHGKNARIFMHELWELLTSAQESIGGIPTKFLEQKREEIRQKKLEQDHIQASLKKHQEYEREIRERRQHEYEERQARKREEEEEERKETRREGRNSTGNVAVRNSVELENTHPSAPQVKEHSSSPEDSKPPPAAPTLLTTPNMAPATDNTVEPQALSSSPTAARGRSRSVSKSRSKSRSPSPSPRFQPHYI